MTELEACLVLEHLPGIGWQRCQKLLLHFGSATAIFKASTSEWESVPGLEENACKSLADWEKVLPKVEKQKLLLARHQVHHLRFGTSEYPLPLSYCSDAPLLLFYQGLTKFKARKIISIVGTRQNTPHGKAFCEELIRCLRPYNPIICSGLARGIDIIAHHAALKHGLETVACLAHGLEFIYPKEHTATAKKILTNGALVTDFLPETEFHRVNFPRRNRLIAGMAHATVVIESGVVGGSMNTANLAHQYGRELYAVPGRYSDYKSQGCHQLIVQHKAQLLSDPQQLVHALGWENDSIPKSIQKTLFVQLNEEEQKMAEILQQRSKIHLDELALEVGQKISKTAAILMELEMQGVVRALPGKYYELI